MLFLCAASAAAPGVTCLGWQRHVKRRQIEAFLPAFTWPCPCRRGEAQRLPGDLFTSIWPRSLRSCYLTVATVRPILLSNSLDQEICCIYGTTWHPHPGEWTLPLLCMEGSIFAGRVWQVAGQFSGCFTNINQLPLISCRQVCMKRSLNHPQCVTSGRDIMLYSCHCKTN